MLVCFKLKPNDDTNYGWLVHLIDIRSYINQSIHFHCKSIDWFLYECNISLIWAKTNSLSLYFKPVHWFILDILKLDSFWTYATLHILTKVSMELQDFISTLMLLNPFHWFSNAFRRHIKWAVAWNGLKHCDFKTAPWLNQMFKVWIKHLQTICSVWYC